MKHLKQEWGIRFSVGQLGAPVATAEPSLQPPLYVQNKCMTASAHGKANLNKTREHCCVKLLELSWLKTHGL